MSAISPKINFSRLFAAAIVAYAFAYSLQVLSLNESKFLLFFFPIFNLISLKAWIQNYTTVSLFNLVFWFIFILYFFYLKYSNKLKRINEIVTLIVRLSFSIPIANLIIVVIYPHLPSSFNFQSPSDFQNQARYLLILISLLSSVFITTYIPSFIKSYFLHRKQSQFAVNSGLVMHYNNIKEMEKSEDFSEAIESLGELRSVKILGITGRNTFVAEESYLHKVFQSKYLPEAKKTNVEIILSRINSKGLKERADELGVNIAELNQELNDTDVFLKTLRHNIKLNHISYEHKPRFKIILLEGNKSLAFFQAYATTKNILDEQVYVYEDKAKTSMYKMIDQLFHSIQSQIVRNNSLPTRTQEPMPINNKQRVNKRKRK